MTYIGNPLRIFTLSQNYLLKKHMVSNSWKTRITGIKLYDIGLYLLKKRLIEQLYD